MKLGFLGRNVGFFENKYIRRKCVFSDNKLLISKSKIFFLLGGMASGSYCIVLLREGLRPVVGHINGLISLFNLFSDLILDIYLL